MDLVTKLIAVVTLILALSIASERLVEIIKGFFPGWFTEVPPIEEADAKAVEKAERKRKANVALLAVICGMITAFLASPVILTMFRELYGSSACQPLLNLSGSSTSCMSITINGVLLTMAMGLLASGGSSLWNSILEYLLLVKKSMDIDYKRNALVSRIRVNKEKLALEETRIRVANLNNSEKKN